jgi:hypothetical protein
MDMPRPGDQHKKLAALVGEWTGDETLHPSPWDPAGGGAQAQVTNRWVADGFALVQEYEQRRNGKVTFRGHGVFWFDPARDEYVMHWWDSTGATAGEYRGRFEGDVLALSCPMPQGGHSRTSWTMAGDEGHTFLMEVSPDGESWQPAMEGRYRKTAAPRKAKKAARKAKPAARTAARAKSARKAGATRKPAAARRTTRAAAGRRGRKAARKATRRR